MTTFEIKGIADIVTSSIPAHDMESLTKPLITPFGVTGVVDESQPVIAEIVIEKQNAVIKSLVIE